MQDKAHRIIYKQYAFPIEFLSNSVQPHKKWTWAIYAFLNGLLEQVPLLPLAMYL